jgi:hypothetical protein
VKTCGEVEVLFRSFLKAEIDKLQIWLMYGFETWCLKLTEETD